MLTFCLLIHQDELHFINYHNNTIELYSRLFTLSGTQKLTHQTTNLPPANFDIYQILSIFANQIDFENYNL